MKNLLITATNFDKYCAESLQELERAGFQVALNPYGRPLRFEELEPHLPGVDAVIAGVDDWNEEVFSRAPRLRAIARFGVGVDNIDIAAASARKIVVSNGKGVNDNAVAELTLAQILNLLRDIPRLIESTDRGEWDRHLGREVRGLTVGLVGFGAIAQRLTGFLLALGAHVLAYDKYPPVQRAAELGVELVPFDELLERSELVTLLVPSLPETQGIMNEKTFGQMRRGAFFVNTARGALVDEDALVRALESGHLAAAAIDVYVEEPLSAEAAVRRAPRLLRTPHTAAETTTVYREMGEVSSRAVIDACEGRVPLGALNA